MYNILFLIPMPKIKNIFLLEWYVILIGVVFYMWLLFFSIGILFKYRKDLSKSIGYIKLGFELHLFRLHQTYLSKK